VNENRRRYGDCRSLAGFAQVLIRVARALQALLPSDMSPKRFRPIWVKSSFFVLKGKGLRGLLTQVGSLAGGGEIAGLRRPQ
jgi:hypothetical protein